MSLKAYDFYIFNKSKLNHFLKWCENSMGKAMVDTFSKSSKLHQLLTYSGFDKEDELRRKILASNQSMSYNDFELDLNCGVSIWFWNDNLVVKLFGIKEFMNMKVPNYLKDFGYWNNSDKPDEIDILEWNRRSKFFHDTIEKLQRVEYKLFDFLTEYHILKSISDVRALYRKSINVKEESR